MSLRYFFAFCCLLWFAAKIFYFLLLLITMVNSYSVYGGQDSFLRFNFGNPFVSMLLSILSRIVLIVLTIDGEKKINKRNWLGDFNQIVASTINDVFSFFLCQVFIWKSSHFPKIAKTKMALRTISQAQ